MSHEMISQEQLSDGSLDYGNGVIGPSAADIFTSNNAEGSLPFRPAISRHSILEVGTLGAVALVAEACGAQAPTATHENPTNTPVITLAPTETPAPTTDPNYPNGSGAIGNTESPSPAPTPAPTPEPTPAATPKPISTITEVKPTKVGYTTMIGDIKEVATEVDLTTIDDFWTDENLAKRIKECKSGDKKAGLPLDITKFQACLAMTFLMFDGYQKTGNEKFYNAGKEGYDYIYFQFPDQRDFIKDYFNQNFS